MRKVSKYWNINKARKKKKDNKKYYTENWDKIRSEVYKRDGHKCVLCHKKGKVHAHHIIPVKISKDNSLNNLVSVCSKCHRKLESIGLKILKEGGGRSMVRKTELKMIAEASKKKN